ncbi:unnamed protein product [Prorocentrum cordatum]|uniref:Uncharacterized protein n=1 Tax=Prorocentrum cordatum TaxID=2364126 RepID=A0ABN9U8W5_9DINO|nr:unnamed protein product [Polarella glacialis]
MSRRRSAGRRANLQACWPPPSEGPNERCESAAARMVVPPPALPRPAPCAQSAALARGGLQVSREIGRKGEEEEEEEEVRGTRRFCRAHWSQQALVAPTRGVAAKQAKSPALLSGAPPPPCGGNRTSTALRQPYGMPSVSPSRSPLAHCPRSGRPRAPAAPPPACPP